MIANVNEQLWINYDLETAVFLDTIAYWVKRNAANKQMHNFHEGRYWTYNSLDAYTKMFPGWSIQNIRTIIKNCVKNGLLLVGNFNKKSYDRTGWYSLSDKAIEYYPGLKIIAQDMPDNPYPDSCVRSNTPYVGSNTAIPTLLPTSSNNTITTNSSGKSKPTQLMNDMIEVYRQTFPDNPQPHHRVLATSLQKTLQTLIKRWPELDPDGNPLSRDIFQRYLNLLRSSAPKFSLGEYETAQGNRKKNNLETFARWNTVVKFLENQYS